eukprot:TRINITY_DN3094_c0_g1_i2.p2 TRINITY_DN3094_c0_g1~~TRINITY_DN3094_c0_g1_i2.p2  ORF type:complete len:152 (+),score=22.15 TRINITY_DN3094_c0_g1_i2:524-979(+)
MSSYCLIKNIFKLFCVKLTARLEFFLFCGFSVNLKSEVEKLCFEKYGGEQGFRVQLKQKEKQREKIKKKLESIKLIKNVDAIIHLLLHEDGELNMPLFLAIAELQNPLGIKKSEESLETISQLREKRKKSADNDDLHSVDPVRSLKRCKRE